jgi:hypothetical protein
MRAIFEFVDNFEQIPVYVLNVLCWDQWAST